MSSDVFTIEKVLGIVAESLIETLTQRASAVKKANTILGIIRKGIKNKTANNIMGFI